MAAPMDLNVPLCKRNVLLQKLQMAQKLGYEVVAINNFLPDLLNPVDKKDKKSKESKINIVPPEQIKIDEQSLRSTIGKTRRPFRQLSRISTVLKDTTQTHVLRSDLVQKYDLIAVEPTNDKTFQLACRTLNVDIITITSDESIAYRLKRPTVNCAIERGIHFEVLYSPGTRDATQRKYFISNAQQLMFWCKGKNVILSSGCEKPFEMRGPHDVANLGLLMDLNEAQAKDAVTKNCRSLLLHAESRRIIKSVIQVGKSSELPPDRKWILDKCSVETVADDIPVADDTNNTPVAGEADKHSDSEADGGGGDASNQELHGDFISLHAGESSDDDEEEEEEEEEMADINGHSGEKTMSDSGKKTLTDSGTTTPSEVTMSCEFTSDVVSEPKTKRIKLSEAE